MHRKHRGKYSFPVKTTTYTKNFYISETSIQSLVRYHYLFLNSVLSLKFRFSMLRVPNYKAELKLDRSFRSKRKSKH